MNEPAIQIQNLTKCYGPHCVVNQLTLEVPKGCILGFLGRNGAGKTTTIRMLMGIVPPTGGSARVLGQPADAWTPELRARVGYLAEGHHVYGWMTVADCGKFQASFYRHWNWDIFHAIIKHFNLRPNHRAGSLSRGQRAGLCLAMALAPEPELLVLDDPALGLDPVARRSLLEAMIYVTRKSGRTILFSSHLLSDVERVADRITVMDRGILRAYCTLDDFRARIRHFVLHFDGTPPSAPDLPNLLHSFRTDRELAVTLVNADGQAESILETLRPRRIEQVDQGLEEAFVSYVGERGEKSFFLHNLGARS